MCLLSDGNQTFAFCFPILEALLLSPRPTKQHGAAIQIISAHVVECNVQKSALFRVLFAALASMETSFDAINSMRQPITQLIRATNDERDKQGLLTAIEGFLSDSKVVRMEVGNAINAKALEFTLDLCSGRENEENDDTAAAVQAIVLSFAAGERSHLVS